MSLFAYISAGMTVVAFSFGASTVYLNKQLQSSRTETALQSRSLKECGARLNNILEDIKSDNAIDNIPDDALNAVPDHWLRPGGAAPSSQ